VLLRTAAGEVAGSGGGGVLSPIALGRAERGMTDRRLLPKLRTGCSTFFSGLPCSNLGDLFDRVGEAPEFVTVPAAEDSSLTSEAPSARSDC
jgi:hypothetical protein